MSDKQKHRELEELRTERLKIYTASSWRNSYYNTIVQRIKDAGFSVYDFRHPPDDKAAFHWTEIDPNWQQWTTEQYIAAINHPIATRGFTSDFAGMEWAEACVLIQPCGRSAHLEAGFFVGAKKPLFVYIPERMEPELTYRLAAKICTTTDELIQSLSQIDEVRKRQ